MSAMVPRVPQFRPNWVVWSVLLGCGLTVVSTWVFFAWASQPFRQVKIAEIVGQPDNTVFVDGRSAQIGTQITTGQQVLLLQNARIGLKRAEQVVARLGEQASATLQADCLQLGEGSVAIADVSGCIGAAIITSQDGVYVLERLGTLGEIKVLSGQATISVPSNPTVGAIVLTTNQKVTLNLTGDEIGPVRLMLPTEVDRIITGPLFQGFQQAIANQNTVAGLPSMPPSPPPSPKPLPAQPQPTHPLPADKVPAAQPQAVAQPKTSPQPIAAPRYPTAIRRYQEDASYTSETYRQSDSSSANTYRPTRRRRPVEPSYESYSYRRKGPRSPAYGSYYRRRSPSYGSPAYTPVPAPPTHPAPDYLPTVPEAPLPEMPAPIDLPPTAPPGMEPLPPPTLVEPPMEPPGVR